MARTSTLGIALAASLLLAGCELKNDIGDDPQPVPEQVSEAPSTKAVAPEVEPQQPAKQPAKQVVRVTNEEGLDAVASNELPADFPLEMPPVQTIENAMRVVEADGSKTFNVTYKGQGESIGAEADRWQAQFEAKGLTVERQELAGGGSKMIQLRGTSELLEGSCIVSVSGDPSNPGVAAVVTWSDRSAVAR